MSDEEEAKKDECPRSESAAAWNCPQEETEYVSPVSSSRSLGEKMPMTVVAGFLAPDSSTPDGGCEMAARISSMVARTLTEGYLCCVYTWAGVGWGTVNMQRGRG